MGTLLLGTLAALATVVRLIGTLTLYVIFEGHLPRSAKEYNILPNASADLAVQLVLLGVLTPMAVVTARLVQRRPMGSLTSVTGWLRWRWMLLCGGWRSG